MQNQGKIKLKTLKVIAFKMFMDRIGIPNLNKIEALVKMYGRNGYSCANYLTLADLYIYEVVTSCIYSNDLGSLQNYDGVQGVCMSVENSPRLFNYIKNRNRLYF